MPTNPEWLDRYFENRQASVTPGAGSGAQSRIDPMTLARRAGAASAGGAASVRQEQPGLFSPSGPLGILQIPLDLAFMPGYVMRSGLKELGDFFYSAAGGQGQSASLDDFFRQIGQRQSWGEAIADWGGTGNKWADRALGFAGDILLDPITYAGAPGAGSLARGGARAIAASAAKDPKMYAARYGANLGDQQALKYTNNLAKARSRVSDAAETLAANPSKANEKALQGAQEVATRLENALGGYVSSKGYASKLDDAIAQISQTGGGISALRDGAMVDALAGPGVSGLRLRPFWRVSGGPQIMSQAAWSRISAGPRAVRGKVGASGPATAFVSRFGNPLNAAVRTLANEAIAAGEPQLVRAALDVSGSLPNIELAHRSKLDEFAIGIARAQVKGKDVDGFSEQLFKVVETPDAEIGQMGELLSGVREAADELRGVYRQARDYGIENGFDIGDIGTNYQLVQALLSGGGSAAARGRTQARQLPRNVTEKFIGEDVPVVRAMLDELGPENAALVRRSDGSINMTEAVRLLDRDFNWSAWREQVEAIAERTFGPKWKQTFEKDPFALARAYVSRVADDVRWKQTSDAFVKAGLGMTAQNFKLASQMSALGRSASKLEWDFNAAATRLTNLGAQQDELVSEIPRLAAEGGLRALDLNDIAKAEALIAARHKVLVDDLRGIQASLNKAGTKKSQKLAKQMESTIRAAEKQQSTFASRVATFQEKLADVAGVQRRLIKETVADASDASAQATTRAAAAIDEATRVGARFSDEAPTLRAEGEQLSARAQTLADEISSISSDATATLDDIAANRAIRDAAVEEQRALFGGEAGVGGRSVALPQAANAAEEWVQSVMGRTYTPIPADTIVNPSFQRDIANAYKRLPSKVPTEGTRAGARAIRSYEALVDDVNRQYDYLTNQLGVKVEFVEQDPYRTAADMLIDITNNNRLRVYSGDAEHPLMSVEENLRFRAVHDYFGHAAAGTRFDRVGEEGAFLHHVQMFSDEARGAAVTELRGQNAFLNTFGEGFPEQKAYLLPERFWGPDPVEAPIVKSLKDGGFTIDLTGREVLPTSGYQVSLGGKFEISIPASRITSDADVVDQLVAPFLARTDISQELLKRNRWLGGWYSEESGLLYLEVSETVANRNTAFRKAIERNQESVLDWDLASRNLWDKAELKTLKRLEEIQAKKGRLTDVQAKAKEVLEKRLRDSGEPTGALPPSSSSGSQSLPVQGADYVPPQSAAGKPTADEFARLPSFARTSDEVNEILARTTREIADAGGVDPLTPQTRGTRVDPLDKQAKNVKVSAQRRISRRQKELDEINAEILQSEYNLESAIAIEKRNGMSTRSLEQKQARAVAEGKTGTRAYAVREEILELRREADDLFRLADDMVSQLAEGAEASVADSVRMLAVMKEADAHLKTLTGIPDEFAVKAKNWSDAQEILTKEIAKYNQALQSDTLQKQLMATHSAALREFYGNMLPGEVVQALETMTKFQNVGAFVRGMQKFTNWWKGYAVLSPGFHTRNYYSGLWNNWIAGVPVSFQLKYAKAYVRVVIKDQSPKTALEKQVASMRSRGFYGQGQAASEVAAAEKMQRTWNLGKSNNRVTQTSRDFGNHTENVLRGSLGAWTELQNPGLNEAARNVLMRGTIHKFHFDYSDISEMERGIKLVVPFWIWQSRNFGLQLELLAKKPQPLMAFVRMRENLEQGENDPLTPEWFRNNSIMPLAGNMFLNIDVPTRSFIQETGDLTRANWRPFLAGTNPAIKAPVEFGMKQDTFTGRPLEDQTIPFPNGWLPLKPLLAPWTTTDPGTGNQVLDAQAAQTLESFMPVFGRLRRLVPSDPASQQSALTAWSSFLGLPIRELTERERINVLNQLRREESKAKTDPVERERKRQTRYNKDAAEVNRILAGLAPAPGAR